MLNKKSFDFIFKSDLIRNSSILITGTLVAQLIPIILQPFLRRYYAPEAFGAYVVYTSLVGILLVIASLKYELAIVLPKKDKEAANILFVSLLINFGFNILLTVLIVLWKPYICGFLNLSDDYSFYLYFVPVGTFLFNGYQSINYWLIRKKKFFAISKNKIIRRSVEGGSQIGFKFFNVSSGLILGDIIGHFANITYGIVQALRHGLDFSNFSFVKLRYIFVKYSEYPKFNVLPSFLSACSYLLPAILINKFFSSEYAGYFDLSKLVLSIPLALVATSLSNVLLQKVSEKYRANESFIKELLPILLIVLLIASIEVIVIYFWGVDLFKLIFGNQWELSGKISKILVWSFALNFIIASFSSIFIAMKKIKLLSLWQSFYFLSIFSLVLFKDLLFENFLHVYLFIEIICYLMSVVLLIYIVLNYEIKRNK